MKEKSTQKTNKFYRGLSNLGKKAMKSNNLFFTFLRSIVSSQCASWIDLGTGFVLFAWLRFSPALATATGAVCGGIVNCIINYKFTFRADNVDWRAVAVKYALIWGGSILLNTFGTSGLYYLIKDLDWLEILGFKRDGYFALARLFVSLMVSWFWNFPMQRYFVYSVRSFDRYAVNLCNSVKCKFSRSGEENEIKQE